MIRQSHISEVVVLPFETESDDRSLDNYEIRDTCGSCQFEIVSYYKCKVKENDEASIRDQR